jgi:hypothetical protein
MRFIHVSVLLLVTLFRLSAQPAAEPSIPVIGTVESVSGNTVHVKTGAGAMTIHADGQTEIWKGKKFHDLSPLEVGDRAFAECRKDASGALIAISIAANVSNFFGVITAVNPDRIEVLANPNADPHSAYKTEPKTVYVDADTKFQNSAKEDLKVGRGVQVFGLDLNGGKVQGSELTVYEGNRPVRMPKGGKVLPLTGPRK